MKKSMNMIMIILVLILFAAIIIWYGNSNLVTTYYTIKDEKIPPVFHGYKIAHVTDFHNADYGRLSEKTIQILKESECDIIVMTGDILDAREPDVERALDFCKKAAEIAPCYYVTGNHEARIWWEEYSEFKKKLSDTEVILLEDKVVELEKDGDVINLIGLMDVGFHYSSTLNSQLEDILPHNDNYKILLTHRPELFDEYKGVDLVFAGHAHGGQVRIPFLGGLFAPGGGVLPKYDKGIYKKDSVTMVLSAGIGNSLFPLRINNNPEVVICTLEGV